MSDEGANGDNRGATVDRRYLAVFAVKRGDPLPGKVYECSKVSPTKYVKLREFENDIYKLTPKDVVMPAIPFDIKDVEVGDFVRIKDKDSMGEYALTLARVTKVDDPWVSFTLYDGCTGDDDTVEYPDFDFIVKVPKDGNVPNLAVTNPSGGPAGGSPAGGGK